MLVLPLHLLRHRVQRTRLLRSILHYLPGVLSSLSDCSMALFGMTSPSVHLLPNLPRIWMLSVILNGSLLWTMNFVQYRPTTLGASLTLPLVDTSWAASGCLR
jgi:hypothetical protein